MPFLVYRIVLNKIIQNLKVIEFTLFYIILGSLAVFFDIFKEKQTFYWEMHAIFYVYKLTWEYFFMQTLWLLSSLVKNYIEFF